MHKLSWALAVLLMSLLSAMPVAAARHDGFVRTQMQRHPPDRSQPPPQRDYRHAPQPDRAPRDGRMTDQDRRDLHRDLDRANRELYKGRR